jgi:hypothetical protein
MRLAHGFDVFDDATETVLDHAAAAVGAGQCFLRAEFHAVLTRVFDIGEADDVRHHFAFRIEALVFLACFDTGDAELDDLVGGVLLDLTLQVNKVAIRIELLVQFGLVMPSSLASCCSFSFGACCTSSGIAQIALTGTDDAST